MKISQNITGAARRAVAALMVSLLLIAGIAKAEAPPQPGETGGSADSFLASLLLAGHLIIKPSPPAERRKRALLVGISKYTKPLVPNGWWNLNTETDIRLLKSVLIDKFKFAEADIIILQNEKATKEAILAEMRKIAASSSKGDIVFIHFSGHGDSIPDDNGDETDGKDEALIPFDYDFADANKDKRNDCKTRSKTCNVIRDDEVGKILDDLKAAGPANVTVSFDSCYSGTATRGDYAVRGGGGAGDGIGSAPAGAFDSPSGLKEKGADFPKTFVFLAASRSNQRAQETSFEEGGVKGKMGLYSRALVKALALADGQTTYRDLFEYMNDAIVSTAADRGGQNPQFEGSEDVRVLDGTAVRQERFVSLREAPSGPGRAVLNTGSLMGATVRSKYAIYAAGTKDPADKDAKKLADAEVIETAATTAVVKLSAPLAPAVLKTARAFETAHFYDSNAMNVVLQDLGKLRGGDAAISEFVKPITRGGAPPEAGVARFLQTGAAADLRATDYDLRIYPAGEKELREGVVEAGFKGAVIERKDGSIAAVISEKDKLGDEIRLALERENRFRMIKGLKDTGDPRVKIEMRITKVDVEKDSGGFLKNSTPKGPVTRGAGGEAELKRGEHIEVTVENKSDQMVYVTVFNLQANGVITAAYPEKGRSGENFIAPRATLVIPTKFEISEPFGEESFRAIATIEPADFSPLIDSSLADRARGMTRGSDPVAEMIEGLMPTLKGGTRDKSNGAFTSPLGRILLGASIGTRAKPVGSVPASWATSSFTYRVLKN